jgi:hypothetical protein
LTVGCLPGCPAPPVAVVFSVRLRKLDVRLDELTSQRSPTGTSGATRRLNVTRARII